MRELKCELLAHWFWFDLTERKKRTENKEENSFVEIAESLEEGHDLNFSEDIYPDVPFEEAPAQDVVMPSSQEIAIGTDLFNLGSQEPQELDNLRLPPHSIEAEQSVLGGLLLNNWLMSK